MGPSPNAVLPDIHQIASGVDTTVAVLGVLSNRKSARLHTRQAPSSAVDLPAALKDSTLPASVCVAEGPRWALGRRHLPVSVWPEATAIPDCRSARASMPFVICSTGDASLSKRPSQIKPQRPAMAARGKERGSARGSLRRGSANSYVRSQGTRQQPAFRLTAGRYLVIVIGCTGPEIER